MFPLVARRSFLRLFRRHAAGPPRLRAGTRAAARAAVLGAALVAAPSAPAQEGTDEGGTLAVEPLADGLWRLHGGAEGNVLALAGSDGTLLVDARSLRGGEMVARTLDSLGVPPVELIVNTHYHWDHLGGNAVFRRRGARAVAHAAVRERAAVDTVVEAIGWHREAADTASLPDAEIGGPLVLRPGDAIVRVLPMGPAHTDGDVAVHFETADVIHTGDVVEVGAYPFIDWWGGGSLEGTLTAVERLIELGGADTRYVPGHGPVVGREELRSYAAMLRTVRNRVAAGIAAGKDLEAIRAETPTAEFDAARGGERAGRAFTGIVWYGLSELGLH